MMYLLTTAQESESESLPDVCAPNESSTSSTSGKRHTRNTVQHSYGRPDFHSILSDIQSSHAGEVVGVFYCGPPALGHTLEADCKLLNRKVLPSGSVAGAVATMVRSASGSRLFSAAVDGADKAGDVEASSARGAQFHFFKEVF